MKDLVLSTLRKSLSVRNTLGRVDGHINIHATDLYDFCFRRHVLLKKHRLNPGVKSAGFGQAVTFEIGRKIQDIVTENLSSILIGKWVCLKCSTPMLGERPLRCEKCNGTFFQYHETNLVVPLSSEFKLTCNVDLIVYHPIKKEGSILEIKSVKPDDFDVLERPTLAYEWQTETYLWGSEYSPYTKPFMKKYNVNLRKGLLMYVAKLQRQVPFKIFEVDRTSTTDKRMKKIQSEVKTFSKTQKVPKRICNSCLHLMAKACAVRDFCFKED